MVLTQEMIKSLEARGFTPEDFERASKLSEMTKEDAGVFMRVKAEEQEKEREHLETPEIEKTQEKEKEKVVQRDMNTQIKEGHIIMNFAANQVYEQDKGAAMDMAASFAKANGISVHKVQKAVAEVVEERTDSIYDMLLMQMDENMNFKEDYIIQPQIEEQKAVVQEESYEKTQYEEEEENDRFAYPDENDFLRNMYPNSTD